MPIYPLSPGQIFREDFTNYNTLTANGGVVDAGLLQNKCYYPTAANHLIRYNAKSLELFRLNVLTVCASITLSAFTGAYRTLLFCGNTSTGAAAYQLGLHTTTNTLYWYDNTTISTSTSTFTSNIPNKVNVIYSCDGSNLTFYINGISAGTVSAGTNNTLAEANLNFYIGNKPVVAQPFNNKIYHMSIYNYAFSAADALDWHNIRMR